MTELDTTRLDKVQKLKLKRGSHDPPNGAFEACVMEAVAYVAGEEWSDHPKCACPVISAFLRAWNDDLPDDDTRTRLLLPLVPKLAGSVSSIELKRSRMVIDWLARVFAPAWLELAGLSEHAETLRTLPELVDDDSAVAAQPALSAAWNAARSASWGAASSAAWSAAESAASRAASRAAWNVAESAALSAALSAASRAAWSAASSAAESAASSAADQALEGTVNRLQQSALELVERMLKAE